MNTSTLYIENGLNVEFVKDFYPSTEADEILMELKKLCFYTPSFMICGRRCSPKRKLLGYGDCNYAFSGTVITGLPWSPLMLKIKSDLEKHLDCHINFALVNYYSDGESMISPHRDDEKDLSEGVPIPTLSFGASRTVEFTRKDVPTTRIHLPHGSLYVMHSSTNTLFKHGIPAETFVKDPRVSISFRSIVCDQKMSSVEPDRPSKRKCNPFDEETDRLFSSIDPSLLEVSDSSTEGKKQNETVYKKDLGSSLFLSTEFFKEQLKVHLRQYNSNSKGVLFPTKEGIAMDLPTWYDFVLKIHHFNLRYSTTSFVANNSVLVLNIDDNEMLIQTLSNNIYTKPNSIKLNQDQFSRLSECVEEMTDEVIKYLFSKCIPYHIQSERRLMSVLSSEEEDMLMANLAICVEKELKHLFSNYFQCHGCVIDHPSQFQHDCMTLSSLEIFESLGCKIFLVMNVRDVAHQFVESVDFISEHFIKDISVNIIKDVIFKKPY